MPTIELTIPAAPEHVRTARLVAAAAARTWGLDQDVLQEVKLAVGEACARAVLRHGAEDVDGDVDGDVAMEITNDGECFVVSVSDFGSAPGADGDEMALALISALVPESTVESRGSGTVVKMVWPIESGATG